jgi:hypothetical protein
VHLGIFNYLGIGLVPRIDLFGTCEVYSKASLWAENCPNFFFFFVWAGTSPKGAGKTEVFSGKLSQGMISANFSYSPPVGH